MSLKIVLALLLTAAPLTATGFVTIDLGTANLFAVLGGSTVTNTGLTSIYGSVGAPSITGFPPGTVSNGALHAGDATATQAEVDLNTAYGLAVGLACGTDLTGQDMGGLTLTPGIYCFASSAQLTGTVFLDAQGVPDAGFLFQIGSTLTTASNSAVNFINSGNGTNVFWQVGSSGTLGTNTAFAGNVLALASITLTTGATLTDGRALAVNGAVTLDTNQVGNQTPEPGTVILMIAGLLGLGVRRARARRAY